MNTIIKMKVGACAMLLGILAAATGPAIAKVTFECKTIISVTSSIFPVEFMALKAASNLWKQEVTAKYGAYWADARNAANYSHYCYPAPQYSPHKMCNLWGTPCAQVKPPSSSAHHPLRVPAPALIKKSKKRLRNTSNYYPTIPNLPSPAMTNLRANRGLGGMSRRLR